MKRLFMEKIAAGKKKERAVAVSFSPSSSKHKVLLTSSFFSLNPLNSIFAIILLLNCTFNKLVDLHADEGLTSTTFRRCG